MPVLITAGLSQEAYRLKRILDNAEVVFADSSPLPQIPGTKSLVLPPYTSSSFVHEVLKACLDLGITKVYPLKSGEVRELAKARLLFAEYQVTLILPSDEWLRNNEVTGAPRDAAITVVEDGIAVAGTDLPEPLSINKETGIFTWATRDQKTEYSLYLVEDAGI